MTSFSCNERMLKALSQCIDLEGDVAECGVLHGNTAYLILQQLEGLNSCKYLHLFDSFQGVLPENLISEEKQLDKASQWQITDATVDIVRSNLQPYVNYKIYEGYFAQTLPVFNKKLCFIHSDCDWYTSIKETIIFANRLLVEGGYMVIHDYDANDWPGVRRAVEEEMPASWQKEEFTGQLIARRI